MTTYGEERTLEQIQNDRRVLRRVQQGIELLKKKHGDEWVDKIDLDTLRLQSTRCCVLGQVYSSNYSGYGDGYGKGLHDLRIDDPAEYGFCSAGHEQTYPMLNRAWRQAITMLRGERG